MLWKSLLIAAALVPITGHTSAQQARAHATPPQALAWCKDLADAHARSAADGRPVLAYFTFDT